ncbi:hypothetical protein D3C77_672990 [compost metagenome]
MMNLFGAGSCRAFSNGASTTSSYWLAFWLRWLFRYTGASVCCEKVVSMVLRLVMVCWLVIQKVL